jgi:hypothetical protein
MVGQAVGIPRIVRELMVQGRYKRVSIEWYRGFEETSWEANLRSGAHGFVLDGVALLGADLPIVQTLQDLGAYLSEPRYY